MKAKVKKLEENSMFIGLGISRHDSNYNFYFTSQFKPIGIPDVARPKTREHVKI